jgi:ornithine cyclodeaminase/alanine dehydrogenase-like protein (mu-crystallin family)
MSIDGPHTGTLPWFDRERIHALVPPQDAVDAILALLRSGFDPADDPARTQAQLRHGEFLLMPSEIGSRAGVKVATVSPENPSRGLPRIQALYVLYDGETLVPLALFDGAALTEIRTPAVSVAAIGRALARRERSLDVVVFGAGPQAVGHVRTLNAALEPGQSIARVSFVTRSGGPAPWSHDGLAVERTVAGSEPVSAAVAAAHVVVCATTSRVPVFDSELLREDAIVIAVGSHDPDARELDAALMRRASVIVEDPATALRECGDVILACDEGVLDSRTLIPMAQALENDLPHDRPVVFKGSGMAWQDLAVADAAYRVSGEEKLANASPS